MDISIFVDILYMTCIAITMFAAVLILCGTGNAFGAQLNWDARTIGAALEPKFAFHRTILIEYPEGGILADHLRGKHISVRVNPDASSDGVRELIGMINLDYEQRGIHVRISDMRIEYSAELVGRESAASIDYRIIMVLTINGFLIREYEEGTTALFDAAWRGIKIDGPVTVSDGMEDLEINRPVSLLQKKAPAAYGVIAGTEAEKLLLAGLIDSGSIGSVPIARWHSLFDPTLIVAETERYGFKGDVATTFSMGESTIFLRSVEKLSSATITSDAKYTVSAIESADSANIIIPGYASSSFAGATEVIGTSPRAPTDSSINPTGQFSVFIIYGMAGMAAAGAAGFFFWSSRKAKKEVDVGQCGIDPSLLRSVETSSASGGYKTNRGEAHLVDVDHDQTSSVYSKNDKRTMPKGWQ